MPQEASKAISFKLVVDEWKSDKCIEFRGIYFENERTYD
jgi:hypothetical protein